MCVQEVAELKEEDLPSDSTADFDDPSSPLSESQYTHVHELINVTMVLLFTSAIANLFEVKRFLKNVIDWQSLGLGLGLRYPTLKRIKMEQLGDINDCIREMLAAWLQQQDNVSQVGTPSWESLRVGLMIVGENELASEIDQ